MTIVSRNTKDGFKFVLEDGNWVLMRASGTEPVVRVYIEATAPEIPPKFKEKVLEAVSSLSK